MHDTRDNAYSRELDRLLAEVPAPEVTSGKLKEPPPERFTRRGLSQLRDAPPDTDEWIDVEELEPLMHQAINKYLADPDPGYALLLAVPAGGGKTTMAVRLAEQTAGARRVLYAGPRRDFWLDIQALASRPQWWYEWLPRQAGDDQRVTTCRHADAMGAWLHRGYDAMTFCANPRICGWSYIKSGCVYHQQKEQAGAIVFGQHAHVALGHPLMDTFSLLIGDELPLSAFLHEWHIPATAMVPPDMADMDLEYLIRHLRWLCTEKPPEDATVWEGAHLYAALPGGAAGVAETIEHAQLPLDTALLAPDLRHAGAAEDAPYGHLLTLCALMLREAHLHAANRPSVPRVRLTPEGLTLFLRRTPPPLPRHIVWLDATGDAPMYEALLQRPVRVVRPRVRLRGTVYQVWSSTNNRGALINESRAQSGQPGGEQKRSEVRAQIERIIDTRGYQRPALVSYKPLGDTLLPGATHTHFGGARGTNRLQDCDALFVVGAPLPSFSALRDTAAMLFFERDTPFPEPTQWRAIDVAFAGQPAAYSVGGFWDDRDMTTLVGQLREAELIQAIHRARPLRRQVDVWLLTNIPLPDVPVTLISLHALFGACDRDGQPLAGIDVLRWPRVLALADLSDEESPLTPQALMETFRVQRATATRWLDALLETGRYRKIETRQEGARGRPGWAICKAFSHA